MPSDRNPLFVLPRPHPRRVLRGLPRASTRVVSRLERAAQAGLAKVVGDTAVRGRHFAAFAMTTAAAEIRHRWPDNGVTRGFRLDLLRARLPDAVEDLTRDLGRSPRPTELAAVLEEDLGDVIEAVADDQTYCGGYR